MTLQRYKEERNGVQPNDEGNLVKLDDVNKLLDKIHDNHMELCKLLTSGWELRKTVNPEDGEVTYYPEQINGKDNWRSTY